MVSNDNYLTVELFNSGINDLKLEFQGIKADVQGIKSDIRELKSEIRILDKNVAVNSGKIDMLQNYITWGIGLIAIIVAFVAIFFLFKREKAEKPEKEFLTVEKAQEMINEAISKALMAVVNK